jgi:preprotein translocase subunit SecD
MKTVGDVLRSADPIQHEPTWSPQERRAIQQRIVAAAQKRPARWARRPLIISAATVCVTLVAGVVVGPRFFSSALVAAAVRLEMRVVEESPAPGLEAVTVSSTETIYLHREAVVRNEDIAEVRAVPGNTPSTFGIEIVFNTRRAERMSRATRTHIGRRLAILIDGQVVALPILRSPIGKFAVIDADYTRSEAERIANGMIGR